MHLYTFTTNRYLLFEHSRYGSQRGLVTVWEQFAVCLFFIPASQKSLAYSLSHADTASQSSPSSEKKKKEARFRQTFLQFREEVIAARSKGWDA